MTVAALTLTALTGCGAKTESSQASPETTQMEVNTGQADGNWHPDKPITLKWATWEYSSTEGQEYLKNRLSYIKNTSPISRLNTNTLPMTGIRRGCRPS